MIVFPSSSIVRILKSTPIVEMYDSVYVSSAVRRKNIDREKKLWLVTRDIKGITVLTSSSNRKERTCYPLFERRDR